jgi:hypothetical protein
MPHFSLRFLFFATLALHNLVNPRSQLWLLETPMTVICIMNPSETLNARVRKCTSPMISLFLYILSRNCCSRGGETSRSRLTSPVTFLILGNFMPRPSEAGGERKTAGPVTQGLLQHITPQLHQQRGYGFGPVSLFSPVFSFFLLPSGKTALSFRFAEALLVLHHNSAGSWDPAPACFSSELTGYWIQ